jgi:hypothetical protein
LTALAAACGSSESGASDGPVADTGGGDGSGDVGLTRWVGHLAMTNAVPFGGSGFCNYTVTMKNVVFDVSLDSMKNLVWMVIDNTMHEAVVGSCPSPAQGDKTQGFEYPGNPQPPTPSGAYAPTLKPLGSNLPITTIAVTLTPSTTTSYASTVRWHRTDQSPPINWTVNTPAPVDVDLVMCDTGSQYCLGGTQQGAMYNCTDGMHFVKLMDCPMGCAPASVPPAPHGNEHCN